MLNIRFHFDYEDAFFRREDIIDWLRDYDCPDDVSLDELSDAELVALLSENSIEGFYDNMVGGIATCIRCELVHD